MLVIYVENTPVFLRTIVHFDDKWLVATTIAVKWSSNPGLVRRKPFGAQALSHCEERLNFDM